MKSFTTGIVSSTLVVLLSILLLVSLCSCTCSAFAPVQFVQVQQQQRSKQRNVIQSSTKYTPTSTLTVLSMATWSNGQAVQGYQDFLNSGQQEMIHTTDRPSAIILSRNENDSTRNIAISLMKLGSGEDFVTTIDGLGDLPATLGGNEQYPIYMIVPPNELYEFFLTNNDRLLQYPENFVFFSGGLSFGNIEDLLKERGYCRDEMTQVIISGMDVLLPTYDVRDLYVSLGVDASGIDKIAGECVSCGKWAGSIAQRLQSANIYCRIDFYREWRRKMWERTVYDVTMNIIGAIRDDPTTIGSVGTYYTDEISDIVWEFSQLLRGYKAITLTYGFEERLIEIATQRGNEQLCQVLSNEMYPYTFGNIVFLQSKTYLSYLYYGQVEKGLLQNIQLPPAIVDDDSTTLQSPMRKGILRADGVV